MKKRLTAALLAVVMMIGMTVISVTAANVTVTYQFSGSNAADKGFAQGTLTVRADSSSGGTYYLYWADGTAAFSGYDPICTLSVANGGSASFTLPANTAIPARATAVLGFKSSSAPTNLNASAAAVSYTLPASKVLGKKDGDLLYSFASYSDTHMCSNEEGSNTIYPYDEQHLADAFKVAAARNVDFIVTTGDHVNNQRADVKGGANPFYPEEWNTYLKILAESDYVNPIYEAIGNHELWNYDTEEDYSGKDWKTGSDYFVAVTGLDSTDAAISSGKAYYEITEPVTGDHFLFMALEGGFYTDRVDEFTDAQLNWLDQKLTAYANDGKNTFILEHANFEKWGAGDQLDNPIYNIPLKDKCASTAKLKALLKKHKNAVFLCGHTHFKFDLQLNYSNNDATSALIIHNSSVGGVRDIKNHTTRVNDTSRELCEGYIVEVYDDATVFYGTNLYYNKINPSATYMVKQSTSPIIPRETEAPTEAPKPTAAPTEAPKPTAAPTEAPQPTAAPTEAPKPTAAPTEAPKPTAAPTEAPKPTAAPTEAPKPTAAPTEAPKPTAAPTEAPKPTAAPTEAPKPTEPPIVILKGDSDENGKVDIADVTWIQRDLVRVPLPHALNRVNADVDNDAVVTIMDATWIQRYLAGIVESLPVQLTVTSASDKQLAAVGASPEVAPAAADLNTLRTQAKSALDKYWLLASYDQYQAVKKAYRQNADYDTLNAAYTALTATVSKYYPGDSVDVYFSNNRNWSNVYAYCSAGHGKAKNASWPGQKMTYVSTNTYGEKIYKITVPTSTYNFIIFTNNSGEQTVDLPLGVTKNQGYYYDSKLGKDSQGHLRCSYYVYK